MVDAIGDPILVDTSAERALGRIFAKPNHQNLPGLLRLLRHGNTIGADRRLFAMPPRVSRSASRSFIFWGRSAAASLRSPKIEEADGTSTHLHADGRRQDQPGFESPLGCSIPNGCRSPGRQIRHARRRLTGLILPGPPSGWTRSVATYPSSASVKLMPSRLRQMASPRRSQATRTIRMSPRLSARSISASSRTTARPTRMPTPTAAA